ncbi:MAG: hypothetical protein Q8M58_15055, partial [Anaerolineales bacterium]|nr:hypothetical protein [Anaerolineales bacterium]
YTDCTDFTESHGKSVKKSVFFSVFIRVIRVQKVLITAIPNEHGSPTIYCFLYKLVNWSVRFSLAKTGFFVRRFTQYSVS